MSVRITSMTLGVFLTFAACFHAAAGELVYRPINPNFGGDPFAGNYLLGTAQAQTEGSGGGGGFSIDFPDFGGIPQPTEPTDPTDLPDNGNNANAAADVGG